MKEQIPSIEELLADANISNSLANLSEILPIFQRQLLEEILQADFFVETLQNHLSRVVRSLFGLSTTKASVQIKDAQVEVKLSYLDQLGVGDLSELFFDSFSTMVDRGEENLPSVLEFITLMLKAIEPSQEQNSSKARLKQVMDHLKNMPDAQDVWPSVDTVYQVCTNLSGYIKKIPTPDTKDKLQKLSSAQISTLQPLFLSSLRKMHKWLTEASKPSFLLKEMRT